MMDPERRHLGIRKLASGETEGILPDEMTEGSWETLGHRAQSLSKVIRAKCLDCSHTAHEVARCTASLCALWPYRMGTNPFRAERSEAQVAASRANAEKLKASRQAAQGRKQSAVQS